jgi:trigger factor
VVTEEDISRYLENIRERNALWETVARPLQVGDRITIDLQGTVEGKEIIKEEDLQLVMAEGAQIITPGFSEKLVGMSAGEEKEFQLPFPTDFRAKDVAGKECLFKVKLKDIKEKKLPELDDDLAKSLGEGLETLEALKTKIRSDLQQVRENLNRRKHEAGVLEAVVASSKVEYPDILVEREIDRIVDEKVRLSGLDNLERYLQNIKKSAEEIREEQREEAKKRVINAIILEKIGELEKVEVAEADIDKEIENIVKVNAGPKEETSQGLNTPTMRESIRNVLRQRKTLRLLSDIALSPETAAKQEN